MSGTTKLRGRIGGLRGPGLVGDDLTTLEEHVAAAAASASAADTYRGAAHDEADRAETAAEKIQLEVTGTPGLVFEDADGNAMMVVTEDDIEHPAFAYVKEQAEKSEAMVDSYSTGIAGEGGFAVEDADGNAIFLVNGERIEHPKITEMQGDIANLALNAGSVGERLDATEITTRQVMFLTHSQSNGYGPQNVLLGSTALAPLRMFGSLRYGDETIAYDDGEGVSWTAGNATAWASYDRVAEELLIDGGETGLLLGGNHFIDQWRRKTGSDFALSGRVIRLVTSGAGGRSAAELMSSPGYLDRAYASIDAGAARANAAGMDFSLGLVEWDQGEQDMTLGTAASTYRATLTNPTTGLPAVLRARQLSATTAVSRPVDRKVRVAGFQTGKHATYTAGSARLAAWAIAVEQGRIYEQEPLWCAICPTYMFTYIDASHLIAQHNAVKRGYTARARAEYHATGIRPRHLRVVEESWTVEGGNDVYERRYDVPAGSLQIDTVSVSNPGALGGSFYDDSENEIAVLSSGIKDGTTDTMRWMANGTSATKFRLGYKGNGVGAAAGGRICFRDQAGDMPGGIFDPDGIAWPMHNWPLMAESLKP